ncbi:MAG: hypothetical protein EP319_07480 [Deltaproteobacteria bacterium]|nr:MAG: hypothetical protein EP319_07480 [Deltaproteobacteria bacterium]
MVKYLLSLSLLFCSSSVFANSNTVTMVSGEKSLKEIILEEKDSFYDGNRNYGYFTGRVTDRDQTANILKVSSENGNTKFFRAGDLVRFTVARKKEYDQCEGFVRSVEDGYFVVYVKDIYPCWGQKEYFRRGTVLVFESKKLYSRVQDASKYRVVLLKRRRDFFNQLNRVNHFLWSFDQQKVLTAAEYDKKILELRKAKERAMELLLHKKQDQIRLQKELSFRLDELDKDLEFYRIDNHDLLVDRWHLDHDTGAPVGRRPQELKKAEQD